MRTLRFLLRKEFLQIRRDHAMLRMLIAIPVIQLVILANAATFEIAGTGMYVVDLDQSEASRGLVGRMVASARFEVEDASASMRRADQALLERRVGAILAIPADFERDLVRAGSAPLQLVFNAEDGSAAAILRSYAVRIIGAYGAELDRQLKPTIRNVGAGDLPPPPGYPRIDVRSRGWYNSSLDYTDFMVPGLLAVLVTIVATAMGAMNIVREKEIGTLEQLNVTPITSGQFIASKLLPFWIIALADLALGLTVGWLAFSIPVRGNLLLVFSAAALYLLVALGVGLWISTVVSSQQQAMFLSYALNMVYLLMSGLFTPIQSMPGWAQWIAQASPVKHFIVIMRAVLVKGAGLPEIATPMLVLAAYGTVVLTLAVRQYDKRAS